MDNRAMAIYENGVLRLLTPLKLPEHAHVQVSVQPVAVAGELAGHRRQVHEALVRAGLSLPGAPISPAAAPLSPERREELARLFSAGRPLSEVIIRERDGRLMPDYYADSSVVVKRHVYEAGSSWFQSLTNPASENVILTARVSMVEVYSAFNRRLREARLGIVDYAHLVTDFMATCLTCLDGSTNPSRASRRLGRRGRRVACPSSSG